jgi:hypothetical protein
LAAQIERFAEQSDTLDAFRAACVCAALHRTDLSDFKDRAGAGALGTVLQNALQQLGHRPETIRVQRPRVAAMLSKVANEMGIPVLHVAELPALNFAREEMERRFSG